MSQIFSDSLILSLKSGKVDEMTNIAREFRCCTGTVMLSPALCFNGGPLFIRSLRTVGINNIICDMRLYGSQQDFVDMFKGDLTWSDISAVTCLSVCDEDSIKRLVRAAELRSDQDQLNKTTKVLLYPVFDINEPNRIKLLNSLLDLYYITRATGIMLSYEDLLLMRAIDDKVPVITRCKKGVSKGDPFVRSPFKSKPAYQDCVDAGATHVIFDTVLIEKSGLSLEDLADSLSKIKAQLIEEPSCLQAIAFI